MPPATTDAPAQDVADVWARTWYVQQHQRLWSAICWIPLGNIVGLSILGPAALLPLMPLAALWVVLFVRFYTHSATQVLPLVPVLRELVPFADQSDVLNVLSSAGPDLAAQTPLTSPAAKSILQQHARTVFDRVDVEGCPTGHREGCRHRRDTAQWEAWIAGEPQPAQDLPVADAAADASVAH